jgi:hypothetical protein
VGTIHTLTNPYLHLDQDLREGMDSILRAVSLQSKRNKKLGKPVPEALSYAQQAHSSRARHKDIVTSSKPSFLREVPEDHSLRIFISPEEFKFFGRGLKQIVKKFAKGLHPQQIIADPDFSISDYFSSVLKNRKISDNLKKQLLGDRLGNRGPGIGPTNERRAACALAIIKDKGLIDGFQVCGEAGKALITDKSEIEKDDLIDYGHHEEAMAVDILVKTSSGKYNTYMPLQIKSSGSCDYDTAKRYLSFNSKEKALIEQYLPGIEKLFVQDPYRDDFFRIKVQRKVLKIGLNDRKLVKTHRKDFDNDIVNKLMAMIEYSRNSGEALSLKQPYQKLTYPERVIAMVKSGFLTPIKDENRELEF